MSALNDVQCDTGGLNLTQRHESAGRSMSQVQPPQPAGSEQPQQPEGQQPASPRQLQDSAESAARRARPSDSEIRPSQGLARHPGVGQHSSSRNSEIQPLEGADERLGRRHEHRHGHSHGRRAHAWLTATQEQQAARAERRLSDAAERPPRALTARNPQFSVDSQDCKGAPPRLPQASTKLGLQHKGLELELMGWQNSPPAKQSYV